MLKMTAKVLAGWVAVAVGLSAGIAIAQQRPGVEQSPVTAASVAQTVPSHTLSGDKRKQANDLLRRARQAMAENDLEAAEALISKAEVLGVKYSVLHLGDTPKKARRDLERKRKAAGRSPRKPSQLFAQFGLTKSKPPPTDPFAARSGASSGTVPETITDKKSLAQLYLLKGRKDLAQRNLIRASHWYRMAAKQQAVFGPEEDSPAKLAADIRRAGGKVEEPATGARLPDPQQLAPPPLSDSPNPIRPAPVYRPYGPAASDSPFARRIDTTPPAPPADSDRRLPAVKSSDKPAPSLATVQRAAELVRQARAALGAGDLNRAETLARQAEQLGVPDSAYAPGDDRPGLVLLDIRQAGRGDPSGVITAGGQFVAPPAGAGATDHTASHALYDASNDSTRNVQAAGGQSIVAETAAAQNALARQVAAEVALQVSKARAQLDADPKAALALLEETRKKVEDAGLEPTARARLLARVDRAMSDTQQFIEQNRPRIELEEKNQGIRDEIGRHQRLKLEIQEKLALMVDDFNKKMDEQRYADAEVVAKRAAELDPNNPVIQQLLWQSKFVRRFINNQALRARTGEGFWTQLDSVDEAAIPFDDREPYRLPDAKAWGELTAAREKWLRRTRRRSEQEMEIEKKLRTPVSLEFTDKPLSEVLEHLARLTEVNLHLDPQGLAEEGVSTDTPVTIEVRHEIMLKSALNLILEPLHLSYVIKDEVLKITSEQMRDGEVHTATYNVADLVVPIPNFVPTSRMGLAGSYHDALGSVGFGGGSPFGTSTAPLAVVASKDGQQNNAMINPALLAQIGAPGQSGKMANMPMGFGPGGLGGGVQADFDSLIDLITSTIQPTTWDDVGGPGSIAPFETNLSIVVSQTQDVHEEIVDLLEQLRRLQDLQVTIEVRFITLNDNFFERIGVDFDFDIDDNIDRSIQVFGRRLNGGDPSTGTEPLRNTLDVDNKAHGDAGITVGLQAPGVFSADLDIPFTQNSYGLAVPQFGGFDATAGAQLGFAILSDIEAFFFINAAQGDRRSNVLQAPKVTLFNGQQAYVSDTSQSPFVISVIPVVGDFAAAQQPVIVVLSEGSFMTVQAVVSNDRRFVRLTVVPFFSKIGEVHKFQFTGSETSTTDTTAESAGWKNLADAGKSTDWHRESDKNEGKTTITTQGTTVQLPTFSFVTVTTTVSVPDGGTVLLGGIKRLSEGRSEFGTPILNKIPYISRLFKNVGIGRETQSLLMMVTPRIIIQEEEEEKLGILPP